MKQFGVVSTAVLFLLLGTPAAVYAQQEQQDTKPRQQDDKQKAQEQTKPAQHQQRPPKGQPGNRRIPEDHFRAHFGREHVFVINRPVIVESRPRFQYSGYWFEIVDPWPVGWAYTDDCYIDYIDDTYYLFDPLHPGVRVVIVVVM